MKEYREAVAELDRVVKEEKAKLAAKVQPIFMQNFTKFFEDFPEFEAVSWEVERDVYDDENYNDEVHYVKYKIREDLIPNTKLEHYEDGILAGLGDWTLQLAQGIVPDYYKSRWYTTADHERLIAQAKVDKANYDAFASKIGGANRIDELCRAISNLANFVTGMDFEFHENVFGVGTVTVTRNGFDVE